MPGRVDPRRDEEEVGGDVPVKYVSLFSGVEAASVAWRPLGWEAMAFCEIEPFPCAVLKERFPEVPNLGDVSKVDWGDFVEEHGRPDVVVGGSPCQSFSVAGRREGLEGASGLMWEYVRAAAELRPRWLLWENVPGALSSTHGEDFRCLLESLDELGYRMAWRVLDAQFYGVAQRRRRLFLVGDLGAAGGGAAEVLFEPESMCGDPRPSREKRAAIASNAGIGAQASGVFSLQSDGGTSLNSNGGGWQCDGSAYTLNLIDRQAVAFAANQRGGVRLFGGDGQTVGAIPANQSGKQVQGIAFRWNSGGKTALSVGDTTPTVTAGDPPALAFEFHAGAKAGSAAVSEDVSPTLTADWRNPAVCMSDATSNAAIDEDMSGTITAHAEKQQPMVSDGYVVRRLTPRECERLQGFPDDWTLIPWRGKPADECPDGPRYKAMGNSMAVNVMRWLGVRIDAVNEGENPDEACSRLRGQIFGV